MCFGIWQTPGKHFLPLADCGNIFPAKSCWDAWRSGSKLMRCQVNTEDDAKLCSPIQSTSEALVVRPVAGRCRGELGALSVDQCRLQVLQFSVHRIDLVSILLRCDGFARIRIPANPLQVQSIRQAADHQTVTMTFFLVQVWLWEVLWNFFLVQFHLSNLL